MDHLGLEALRLLPYRIRPGVYGMDSREGATLLNLYAYAPGAEGWPAAVRTHRDRKPTVFRSGEGHGTRWSPKEAVRRLQAGEEPAPAVVEALAMRWALLPLLKACRASASQGADPYGYVSIHTPGLDELAMQWIEEHGRPEVQQCRNTGVWFMGDREPWVEHIAEVARMEVRVVRNRWGGAAHVVRRGSDGARTVERQP